MADNLGFTPGTGANIKTDQGGVSGAHMQVVKLAFSADGDETLVTADADGLEVQIGKSITIPTSPLAGQVWPVSDNGGVISVDDAAGSLTVDAPATAPLAVRLSTGAAFQDFLPVTDNGSTLSVDDGGGALTVDGTVTANQGTPVAVASAWPTKVSDGTNTVGITTVGSEYALKADVLNPETDPVKVSPVRPSETRVTKSQTIVASTTGGTVWDPAAGKKFVITHLFLAAVESGRVTIFDGTNAEANIVFDGYLYGAVFPLDFQARPWASSTVDNILKATTDADCEVIITAHGYEV
jgi:hypothetical protein